MNKECVSNVLTLIQPCITKYDLASENAMAVICDMNVMQEDVI